MQPEQTPQDVPKELSHAEYNAVIDQLTPVEIRLVACEFALNPPTFFGTLRASATLVRPKIQQHLDGVDGERFTDIIQQADFSIVGADGVTAAKGRAMFQVRVRTGFEPPNEFWTTFMSRNVKLYTQPALRDLIASLSARAGLVCAPLGSVAVMQRQVVPPN